MKKYFIITVDTEGDNLWNYKKGENVKTANALFIPRFQDFCEKYGFKPVYLSNYEMMCSRNYTEYIANKVKLGLCEVGIHIHAWNNPPEYQLDSKFNGNPFLVEYPDDVMESKFKETYDLICKEIGKAPVSHRAGRWVMDERYFSLLEKYGIKVDCSYTPTVSWMKTKGESRNFGCDYSNVVKSSHFIGKVLEVPMTIYRSRMPISGTAKEKVKQLLRGKSVWLRPASSSISEMKWCIRKNPNHDDYVEFMIHSSELMPSGSPYFLNEESIRDLYDSMERVFSYARRKGYEGCTLEEYCKIKNKNEYE